MITKFAQETETRKINENSKIGGSKLRNVPEDDKKESGNPMKNDQSLREIGKAVECVPNFLCSV